MWDGWVDIEKPHTHIIGHWNYAQGTNKNVYVVSSTEKVELFINGVSKGFGEQTKRFLFTFKNIEWQPGEIKAVGYDSTGKAAGQDSKKTAGDAVAIRLAPHTAPGGLRADGADIAMIDVEVVDKAGSRCPTALNLVNFNLSGEAEWRGGLAQGPDNYILSKSLPVEGGVNRVMIRSTTKAGTISLNAAADGLKPASIQIGSKPFSAFGGLAFQLPSDGLPANLGRGPTPQGESFKNTRRSLEVAAVTAGSNAEKAKNTIDDDETTDWSSDGKNGTGWIKYELTKPESMDQICLKLVGWRTQSYPIRITVGDKVVYTGDTPRSFGYVTISFAPSIGKTLKIELTGNATNRDGFGNIVEITGAPDPQSAANKGGKATLGIVEAELYSSVL
jgi:hypothetical protein